MCVCVFFLYDRLLSFYSDLIKYPLPTAVQTYFFLPHEARAGQVFYGEKKTAKIRPGLLELISRFGPLPSCSLPHQFF
jgi:hypothetical protein